MTTKTLGQVLYEAEYERERYMKPYDTLCESTKQEFEASASAVAAVVREQCAQEAREHHRRKRASAAIRPLHVNEWDAHDAIRSMKL